ncbi:Nex18 symbiotically induced protein [Longibacter salinarum]|uniref:Nex18 symbiotically induced protein n=2 Tax=Longibacter salinarum TaxID=1850348 RepID=A0A2A8CXR0_9BACT|nr:Nex18 symbiotically induced protein [Longibacter salinarum]
MGCDETADPTITNSEINIAERLNILNETGTLASLVSAYPADTPLAETFKDDSAGPFTVFAPTSGAINATLASLDADGDGVVVGDELTEAQLVEILQYHVVASETFSEDLGSSQQVQTLNGEELTITSGTANGETVIEINGDAQVVIDLADIEASNGVVHVIDGLLIPPGL